MSHTDETLEPITEKFVRLLNEEEKRFLGDWVMLSVKFSTATVTPCGEIWEDCLITQDGEIVMKRHDIDVKDIIKVDTSDGKVIVSIKKEGMGSFMYYGELVD